MNELYLFVGSYLSVVVLVIVGISMMQRGFFWAWVVVKMSRGEKTLIRVMSISGDYYKPGMINEGFLDFKDRKKENRKISMQATPDAVYRACGVDCLDVDDKNNTVLDRKAMRMVNGYDAKQYDALYERILMRPVNLQKLILILIILVCLVILIVGIDAYLDYRSYQLLTKLGTIATNTITPGAGA